MELLQAKKTACDHCGDPCDHSVTSGDFIFCCQGCKTVHQLLDISELNKYYEETSLKNKSCPELKAIRKYVFLDNENMQQHLLTFRNDEISVVRLSLPGIHCSSCIYLLEHLPRLENSILRVEVNFVKREVFISFNHHSVSMKEVAVLLSQLGYPPDISLDSLDKTKEHVTKFDIGTRIAVAGFCFGNAMLMSMPEYLDTNFLLTESFKKLFGGINLLLALPVVFYSGNDYFTKAWRGLRYGNLNIDVPIALGMLTLCGRSIYEIITLTGSGYIDSLTGLIFFLLIGKWYQGKTYQALSFERDYTSYFPVSITCLIEGKEFQRSLRELKKGDLVVIHNDELIPADGQVVSGEGNIDYSFVTGESQPVEKKEGQKIFAGGRQKGGELVVVLEKSVDNSELTQLWNSDVFRKRDKTLSTWIDKISHYFTLIIILIALGSGVYWWFTSPDLIWNSVTAVLIVACPCALALSLPFAYGHALRLFGKNGLYLKNAEVVEALSRIDTVIFDKTGTLTSNGTEMIYEGKSLSTKHIQLLKSALGNSAHPLSRTIYNELPEVDKLPVTSFEEVIGKGFTTEINGYQVRVGSAEYLNSQNDAVLNESRVHVSIDGYLGYFAIQASYRQGIFDVLKELQKNYFLSLLSGDNESERITLKPYFGDLRFDQKPADKLKFMETRPGHHLMIGDGLNDAGALKKATVGIAVSEDIHQFAPACDAIIGSDSVSNLPVMLKFSKKVIFIVFMAFVLSFLYNFIGLSFAMTGHLTPLVSAILMPVSSVTVVSFVTLMVSWEGKRAFVPK